MNQIIKEVRRYNLPEEKFLGDWIVATSGFSLEKYRRLQASHLSIFSINCFAGVISHTLSLPFCSPTINLFFNTQDYLKFLHAPQTYMKEKLVFKETNFDSTLKINYPVVKLGDIELYMNHYRDFDEAVKIWERRKARINWDNLLVTMHTESKEILEQFDALPYGKKVCFVPFKSDLDSAWYVDPAIKNNIALWRIVNGFAIGDPFYYDPFDMLLYGKKTPLIEM